MTKHTPTPWKMDERNEEALESYDFYKEISDVLDRVNIASGKKPTFRTANNSTLNAEINQYGVGSTVSYTKV